VAESAGEGIDRILTSVSYTLAPGVEVEQLMTTAAGGTSAINLTGNELNNAITGNAGVNTLTGGAGNDTLDGRVGADTMKGGLGDDTYVVENAGDVVVEGGGAGTDLVKSSVTFTLGAAVENLTLTGSSAINGTGNSVANVITGNDAANIIDGGAGADTMKGGLGNDTYVVAQAGDIVMENASAGTDLVQSSVGFTLGANVENLTLTGASAINGTGNTLANLMTGNGAANSFVGGAGTDTLNGAGGNDTLDGGADRDVLTGGTGADIFLFRPGGTAATEADADKINDFATASGDKIDLHAIDANSGVGGNQAFAFIGTQGFHNVAGELRYEVVGGFTFVSGDMDGDGLADMMIRLAGSHVMAASDFVL
jgi:Ca2+-binding RTX toxin-like protein